MWTRVVRVAIAGIVLAGVVVAVGVVDAEASSPGENGRLVYNAGVFEDGACSMWDEIFTMNPDGTDVRRLTFDGGECTVEEGEEYPAENLGAAWSPRGDVIAYVHWTATGSELRLMDPDGVSLGTVTDAFRVRDLSWSPDGQHLAFLADVGSPGGPHGLWVIGIDGSNPRLLLAEPDDPEQLTFHGGLEWSPAGDTVAFGAFATAGEGVSIHLIDPDGSDLRQIDCGGNYSQHPEWSPDGGGLFCSSSFVRALPGYVPGYSPGADIWMTELSDGSTHRMTTLQGNDWWPIVSPDGTRLLFVSTEGSTKGLWRHDPLVRIGDFRGFELDWQPRQGSFWDDERSVFQTDIEWMAAAGITRGCNPPDNDRYCPTSHVTRGQMAAFLVRALGLTERLPDPFSDDDDSIFEVDIEKLAAAGVTKGCNPPVNDRFCPDDLVTRGQMAAFLVRALGYTDNGGGNLFVDDDDSIFERDIDRLGTAGVTKGCNPPTNDRYCPTGNVTRGQMAAFLHRALG